LNIGLPYCFLSCRVADTFAAAQTIAFVFAKSVGKKIARCSPTSGGQSVIALHIDADASVQHNFSYVVKAAGLRVCDFCKYTESPPKRAQKGAPMKTVCSLAVLTALF